MRTSKIKIKNTLFSIRILDRVFFYIFLVIKLGQDEYIYIKKQKERKVLCGIQKV